MTDSKFELRVQSRAGRSVLKGLNKDSTLSTLQNLLEEKTNIPSDQQKILFGYPPKELSSYDPNSRLCDLHLVSGETMIVEMLPSQRTTDAPPSKSSNPPIIMDQVQSSLTDEHSAPDSDSVDPVVARCLLSRKVVPADNSCLFESIRILLCNGKESVRELRELAAGIILSNPHKFTSSVLGRTTTDYVEWILKDESWGGAIELSVFCEHYKTELDVVDIQTQRIDQFGQDQHYTKRALLIYDGIHYDPLVVSDKEQTTVFPSTDDNILVEALKLAKEAHKARQYTDVSKFSLRCLVCGAGLNGQTDALSHAERFGHTNFAET